MVENVGSIDRAARVLLGVVLVVVALGLIPGYQTNWGWIGLVPLITGIIGTCPLYSLFGLNTCNS